MSGTFASTIRANRFKIKFACLQQRYSTITPVSSCWSYVSGAALIDAIRCICLNVMSLAGVMDVLIIPLTVLH